MSSNKWALTLRLPKSTFPPRPDPGLRQRFIRKCADDLYRWQALHRPATRPFVLHDGPPYANGDLHVGHALNKLLKDMILRVKIQQGYRVHYRPGWDCHGLPIELKALTSFHKASSDGAREPTALPQNLEPARVRKLAHNLAARTVVAQMREFRSFGVMADWDAHWTTMQPAYIVGQLRLFRRMAARGLIQRRHKPVYWSPSSRTALAEAELEYNENHQSTAAYVKLPVCDAGGGRLAGIDRLKLVIWTTTPWTLPANQAVAVHDDLTYMVVKLGGDALVIGEDALERITAACSLEEAPEVLVSSLKGGELKGMTYTNRLQGAEAKPQPVVHADFVSAESGSGLVHLAPGHGFDDYDVCTPLGLPVVSAVDDAGLFTEEACRLFPGLPRSGGGADVLKGGSKIVLQLLGDDVLHSHKHRHKYPYDWRTKQPIVVRATAQWFADVGSIKQQALDALAPVRFFPETGRTRLESFIKGRSEWCISRQRAWGVPIPALYDDATGEAIMTDKVIAHIIKTIGTRKVDAWWSDAPDERAWIPGELQDGRVLRRGTDTMDVWFDSGSSWTQETVTSEPADVYLEGTDQHRGWFQSSLLTRVAAQWEGSSAQPPFRTLVTHGFTLDSKGKKMSKSLGNIISPTDVMEGRLLPPLKPNKKSKKAPGIPEGQGAPKMDYDALGPDALRLWAASVDYTKDVVIGETALASVHSMLKKYRTILKMLLGSMEEPRSSPSAQAITQPGARYDAIDQIALMNLSDTMATVAKHYDSFEFYKGVAAMNVWVSHHFSAVYLEALKDKLYCRNDGDGALVPIFDGFCRMLAPVAPLLVEEALDHAPDWLGLTIHHPTRKLYDAPLVDPSLLTIDRSRLRQALPALDAARGVVNAAVEQARVRKKIGQSLQSDVTLLTADRGALDAFALLGEEQLASLFVVSTLRVVDTSSGSPPPPPPPPRRDERDSLGGDLGWEFTAETMLEGSSAAVKAVVRHPVDHKCPRCWRYLAPENGELCRPCDGLLHSSGAEDLSH
ncbi:hypothetical protein RB595_006319 [Gaeumannomyces hyphopodioides]